MPLINCKVELKLKWMNHYVLSANGKDNDEANSNNIIFNIKDTKLIVSLVTLSAKDNENYQKSLSKGFKGQCIGINIKQKVRIKIQQISIDILDI